jgi:serine/threonine protein kinase
MSLDPGTRIGPYEITGSIGAGGMGEVYRARDTKLDRDVALKVLPALFTDDPDRLARFEREAKSLAALNHPHNAPAPFRPSSWSSSRARTWLRSSRAPADSPKPRASPRG